MRMPFIICEEGWAAGQTPTVVRIVLKWKQLCLDSSNNNMEYCLCLWKLRTLKTDSVYSVCSLCVKTTQCLSVCTLTPVLNLVWRPCCVHTVCTLNWRPGSVFVSLHTTLTLNVWRPCGVWVILIADRYWCSSGELPDRVMVFGQWLLTSGWLPVAVCTQWVFETLPTATGLAPASSPIYPMLLSALSC